MILPTYLTTLSQTPTQNETLTLTSNTGIAPIHHAVLLQRLSTVDILLRHGADINIFLPPETRLWLRADIPWHQHLLPPILDVGTTPLGIAARAMLDVPMVKFLLGKGADPNLEFSDCMFPPLRASLPLALSLPYVHSLLPPPHQTSISERRR